ncbi:MAG TPA: hypothetical protein VNK04_18505 [Gemmataceae bacterium]|jgi:hypothetical protein|nr:hypothetical protein [Gemmataceae bacterium]
MADPLERLAARVASEPFFLAAVLAAYAQSEGLDDAGLAAVLGCPVGELVMVRLCRAPRDEPSAFWEDVTCIAERFGMEPQRLAEVVKRGRVILRLRAAPAADHFLSAARDREVEPPDQPPEAP